MEPHAGKSGNRSVYLKSISQATDNKLMKITPTAFNDLYILDYKSFKDDRGEFVKTIHDETYQTAGLDYRFTESFYSISKKNVLRGMHFQTAPFDHIKVVTVLTGKILDIVLDIRSDSDTFGKCFSIELSEENRQGIYIGKGFAHGFLSLRENSLVEYHTTCSQNSAHEGGILWNSFDGQWNISEPVLSARDKLFEPFLKNKKYF